MKKLLKFLTIVSFLVNMNSYAQERCEEVELGQIGKNFWIDSLTNGLKGELVSQIQRKDDLTEKLLPEVEISLTPRVDFNFRFTRSIKDNLPLPTKGKISSDDYFSLKVQNKLNMEFLARKEGPFFFAEGNTGVSLAHSTNKYPGHDLPPCELYAKILDLNTEKGLEALSNVCKDRKKLSVLKYYDGLINLFSQKMIGKGLEKIFDSEKNLEYAKDPLAPMKLHSMLGFPIDSQIFRANSNAIAIGDIIEHSTFYGIKPLGVNIDILSFLSPSYAHYRHVFRTMTYKKLPANKVLVELEDTVLSGNEKEIYKIRPKLLSLIKLNMGAWSIDDFRQRSLLQRFEIDLSDETGSGQEFFKKILKSAYSPTVFLGKDSVLIDYSGHEDNVKVNSPIFRDSAGEDNKIILRIPGLLSYEKRSFSLEDNITIDNDKYLSGERLLRRNFQNNISFWGIPEVDNQFECRLKIFSNSTITLEKDSSMNIECSYYNKFSDTKHVKQASEFLEMITLNQLDPKDKEILSKTIYETQDKLNLYTNLSFSKKEIEKILVASEEDIYHSLAKLIFGPEAKNVFSSKYHKLWSQAKPILNPRRKRERSIVNSKEVRECSSFLSTVGITEMYNETYSRMDGVAGRNKGIDSYKSNKCYNYYKLAKEITESLLQLQQTVLLSGELNKIIDVFEDLDKVGLYQSLLAVLAGGVQEDKVRYTYILTSPYIDQVLANSNGLKYDIENSELKKNLSSELDADLFSRVKDLRYTYNTCTPDIITSYLKLNYPVKDKTKIWGQYTLTRYLGSRNNSLTQQKTLLDHMIYNTDGEYINQIQLDEPLDKNNSHNMYFELLNKQGNRLSREVKVFLKKTY